MIHTDASTQCSLKVLPYDSEEAIVRQNFLGGGEAANGIQSVCHRVFNLKKGEGCDYTIDSR